MKTKLVLLPGGYDYLMSKAYRYGRYRVFMMIAKGTKKDGFKHVGQIYWHSGAKRLVFESNHACTKELLRYILPFLNKKTFYRMWRQRGKT